MQARTVRRDDERVATAEKVRLDVAAGVLMALILVIALSGHNVG